MLGLPYSLLCSERSFATAATGRVQELQRIVSTNIRAKELKRLEYEVDNDRFVVKMMLDSFLISEFDPFVLMMELNLLFFYFSIQ